MRSTTRRATEVMPIVLALVLAACGGAESADPTTTTTVAATTTMASTTSDATTTTAPPVATSTPATTVGDLPTELGGGTYLVGSEILPGIWAADECGCPWAIVDASGEKTAGTGDDAIVPTDAYSIELSGCVWTYRGE